MKIFLKILIGVWLWVWCFWGGVFGDDSCSKLNDKNAVITSILIDKKEQESVFKCTKPESNWYFCYKAEIDPCKDVKCNCSQFFVYKDSSKVNWKKGLDLIQSFLWTILTYTIKLWAMLAVLAIVVWWIQVSMSGDSDGESPLWKDKIMWWIAALIVLFFAGVILHFINPVYYHW